MTPETLRSKLTELGLTDRATGRLLSVSPRTVRRWIGGKRPIPDRIEGDLDSATREDLEAALYGGCE